MRFKFYLAALAATTAFATPAFAAVSASATAEARGLVLQPLTLTKVNDLDFGTVLASTLFGQVTINADTGNRTSSGGVTQVASNNGQRGLFAGAGTAGQLVTLTLSPPTGNVLVSTTNPADTISISNFVLGNANATSLAIDATGAFQVGVGGTFDIAASQPNGFYKANFNLTANYQ